MRPAVSRIPYALDCKGSDAHVRPQLLFLACGDGAIYLTISGWSRWSTSLADGTGAVHVDNCQPDCATGHYSQYAARITLRTPVVEDRRRYFTVMVVDFVRRRPGSRQVVYCPLSTLRIDGGCAGQIDT